MSDMKPDCCSKCKKTWKKCPLVPTDLVSLVTRGSVELCQCHHIETLRVWLPLNLTRLPVLGSSKVTTCPTLLKVLHQEVSAYKILLKQQDKV